MVSVFADAFLKALMEVGFDSLQHCSVDLSDFHAYSVLQLVQCTGTITVKKVGYFLPKKVVYFNYYSTQLSILRSTLMYTLGN